MAENSLLQTCVDNLKKRLEGLVQGITPANIMTVVRYAMEIVELTQLKGKAQKDMALQMVRTVIIETCLDPTKKQLCLNLLDEGVVEQTIDLVVAATKGNIDINKEQVITLAQSCCTAIFKKK